MNKKHSILVDSDIETDTESDKMFDCELCGALYRDQETLNDHKIKCGVETEDDDENDDTVCVAADVKKRLKFTTDVY